MNISVPSCPSLSSVRLWLNECVLRLVRTCGSSCEPCPCGLPLPFGTSPVRVLFTLLLHALRVSAWPSTWETAYCLWPEVSLDFSEAIDPLAKVLGNGVSRVWLYPFAPPVSHIQDWSPRIQWGDPSHGTSGQRRLPWVSLHSHLSAKMPMIT